MGGQCSCGLITAGALHACVCVYVPALPPTCLPACVPAYLPARLAAVLVVVCNMQAIIWLTRRPFTQESHSAFPLPYPIILYQMHMTLKFQLHYTDFIGSILYLHFYYHILSCNTAPTLAILYPHLQYCTYTCNTALMPVLLATPAMLHPHLQY